MRLGTSQTMAGVAAVVALVLTVAVVGAVMAASGGGGDDPEPVAQTEPAATTLDATPSPSASPSPSPSPSPSESASPEDEADPPREDAAEETEEEPAPDMSLPADGWYRLEQEASGLCLSTGPEPGNEARHVVVLGDCGSADLPAIQVTAWDEGVYVFNMHFPDWNGCVVVDGPADSEGYLMGVADCEFIETQFWELTALGDGVYTIATSASGLCMGILEGRSANAGEPTATDTCDSGNGTQRFTLS